MAFLHHLACTNTVDTVWNLAIAATYKTSANLTFNAGFAAHYLGNLNPTCVPGHSAQSTKAEINMTFTPRFVSVDRFGLWERSKLPESLMLVGSMSRKERAQKLVVLALIANRNSYEVCETFLPPGFYNCAWLQKTFHHFIRRALATDKQEVAKWWRKNNLCVF